MTKKKILIIIQRWHGGHGVVAKNVSKELRKRGYKVKVISREEDLKADNFFKGFFQIRKKVKREDYDILYVFDWSLILSLIGFKNLYGSFHGHNKGFIGYSLQSVIGYFLGDKLVVVGDSLKKRFGKSNVIYNGVDLNLFYDRDLKRDSVGWIKRDYEEINENEIKRIARERRLRVLIAENTDYNKMPNFYSKCRVFISKPKSFTGFNMCWIEAKACNVPEIIGNDNGIGIKRVLESDLSIFSWKKNVDNLLKVWRN